jgi:drug/metabolite transporter (DMT)-like permease
MSAERGRILVIMLGAVVALALGETLLAKGMKRTGRTEGGWTAQATAVLREGSVWAGCALLILHLGLYMAALRGADLSYALPLTAASYLLTAILAKYYLHEQVGTARWLGTILITLGVAIVALGEARAHP